MDLPKIFDKTIGGELNSILLHFCKVRQHVFFLLLLLLFYSVFFLFQSVDVRALENLSDRFFNWISCNKCLKAKISFFSFLRFFSLTPLRLECSRIRKIASFLTSHKLKKYKNLHPQSFRNGAETW